MSKREVIARYALIIKKLRRKSSDYKEISEYLSLESEFQKYDFEVSKRTFQRDLNDIRSLYNIDIQYDTSRKVYCISDEQRPEVNERILEAFETFHALNISDRLSTDIHFEKRRPKGTEHLYGILHAIKNKCRICFSYEKFGENEISSREVEPYALKEFKNRWYVIVRDLKDLRVKSFGLDRIKNLEISNVSYQGDFDIDEHFKYYFGIISPCDNKPEKVVLSFDPEKGGYIKSLPLHETQISLVDNDKEFRIELEIFITKDFKMEILSHGDDVKVIHPQSLKEEVKKICGNILQGKKT